MTLENLATARDWAVIILTAQAIVVAAVLAFVAWQTYRAMRHARPKIAQGLHQARHTAIRASEGARRGVLSAAHPFVWTDSVRTGMRAAWTAWRRGRGSSAARRGSPLRNPLRGR